MSYRTLDELADAIHKHFDTTDMPEFVRCEVSGGHYSFETNVRCARRSVRSRRLPRRDDGIYYWGTNTPFTDPLVIEGFTLTSMHASEFPSPHFIANHLEDLAEDTPCTLGCVVVSFDAEADSPEWAWVTG